MPIKNLQPKQDEQGKFPVIGKLRKGAPKQTNGNGKEVMGKDLNHFRFDTQDAKAATDFAAQYGEEPTAINGYLPFASLDENFSAWMEEYSAGGLQRRCDGENQIFSRDDKGKASHAPKPCEKLCNRSCGCKQVGRLTLIVPELMRLASVTVETHSVYDIVGLTQNLQAAHIACGRLQSIPFVLSRREQEISTPGESGKRVRRKKSLLFIEPNPEYVQRKLIAMRTEAFALLPGPTGAASNQPTNGTVIEVDYAEIDDDDANPPSEAEINERVRLLEKFDTMGLLYYRSEESWAAKLPKIVEHVTTGATQKLEDLTIGEISKLIAGLEAQMRTEYRKLAGIIGLQELPDLPNLHGEELGLALTQLREAMPIKEQVIGK